MSELECSVWRSLRVLKNEDVSRLWLRHSAFLIAGAIGRRFIGKGERISPVPRRGSSYDEIWRKTIRVHVSRSIIDH